MITDPELTERLVRRACVIELLDEFYGRVDRGESVADLLDEQAEFATPVRNAKGREAVAALLLSLFQMRRERGHQTRHFGASVNVESLGPERIRVRSLAVVLMHDNAGKSALRIGEHNDIVVFDDNGTCRFVSRVMTPALQFALTPLEEMG